MTGQKPLKKYRPCESRAEFRNISRSVLCLSKTLGSSSCAFQMCFALRDDFSVSSFVVLPRTLAGFRLFPLTGKWRYMSEKGQSRKSMFVVKNMEELRRLYDSDTPVLAFKRRTVEGWTPEHSHPRGQLVALTQGLLTALCTCIRTTSNTCINPLRIGGFHLVDHLMNPSMSISSSPVPKKRSRNHLQFD
jgi:hypothetical protein